MACVFPKNDALMRALNVFRSPLMICFASSSTELDYQRLLQCVSVHVVRMFLYVYVLLALALYHDVWYSLCQSSVCETPSQRCAYPIHQH